MNNWQNYTISELCDIKVSGVDKKIYANEIPVQLCNYMDAYRNDYLTRQTDYSIGSVNHNELRKFNLVKNDVVITKDSETPEDIAVSSVVLEDLENVVCGYHLAILQPRDEVDGTFLMHSLKLPSNQRLFYKIASGSTRYGLTIGGIESVTLKIPSLPAQRKVAKILKMCDTVISQTEQAIKKYQAIKQGMMTDLFTRGIDVNTGKLRPSYKEQPDLYKESELGWIPKDWELSKFEDFVIPIDGDRGHAYPNQSQLHSEGHCLFLSAKNVTKSGFAFNKNIFISHERDNLMGNGKLDRGDIIITTRGTVGNIAMYDDSVTYEHIRINSGMLILRNKVSEKIANQFIKAFLLSHVFSKQLERVLSGSAQPQITVKNVNAIYMLFPATLVEQESIVNRMIAMDRKIQTEQDTLKKYQQIKAGLMQDLLTGKVEVQTDDVS